MRDHDVHRITDVQPGPTPEQHRRNVIYTAMMATRMVAIVVAVIVPGFWRAIAVVLGIFIPYIAVVLANAVHTKDQPPDTVGFTATHKVALSDHPFEGVVIPDDARDLDDL
jgi:xanthine/uracil permease